MEVRSESARSSARPGPLDSTAPTCSARSGWRRWVIVDPFPPFSLPMGEASGSNPRERDRYPWVPGGRGIEITVVVVVVPAVVGVVMVAPGQPNRPYPGASGAAGGVDARRWRILSSNPAVSAARTPPPSATIQTFEPSLAASGVAVLGGSTTSSTRAAGKPSTPTPGSVLAGPGAEAGCERLFA